jgi:hypothetical protein
MGEAPAAGTGSRLGYLVVLAGCVAFVASCFLPYYDPGTLQMPLQSLSLFRLTTSYRESELASAGAFLNLFAGVATVASVSLAGLRGHRWARPALLALSVAWSLTWIGTLLGATQYLESPRVGYWSIVVSIGVVIAGSITVWRSAGTSTREPQMTSV